MYIQDLIKLIRWKKREWKS